MAPLLGRADRGDHEDARPTQKITLAEMRAPAFSHRTDAKMDPRTQLAWPPIARPAQPAACRVLSRAARQASAGPFARLLSS